MDMEIIIQHFVDQSTTLYGLVVFLPIRGVPSSTQPKPSILPRSE